MQLKRTLIIAFALLSAIALWDMSSGPGGFGKRIFEIEGGWDEVTRVPSRPPDVEERRSLEPIPVGDGGQGVRVIDIANTLGRLEIGPSPTGEVTAEYTVRVWGDRSQNAAGRAASFAGDVAMAWVLHEGRARLTLDRPEELPSGIAHLRVDVRLGVPQGIDILAEHMGDVVIEEISGSVRLDSAAGRAVVRQIQGPVAVSGRVAELMISRIQGPVHFELRGGRGDIQEIQGRVQGVANYGELVVEDVTGDVNVTVGQGFSRVSNVSGDLTLKGSYGESRVTGVAGDVAIAYTFGTVEVGITGSADLSLDLGEMEVYLEGDGGWTVDAVAEMGEIETALPLAREESGVHTRVSGTIGDGAHQLKMDVNRGTAQLARR